MIWIIDGDHVDIINIYIAIELDEEFYLILSLSLLIFVLIIYHTLVGKKKGNFTFLLTTIKYLFTYIFSQISDS